MRQVRLTAVIEKEGDGYVALCPEIDVASQGNSIDDARVNLREAVQLFLESANDQEMLDRLSADVHVEPLEVTIG